MKKEQILAEKPWFIAQSHSRRYSLAAGLSSGLTVLDAGCGMAHLVPYIPWCKSYLGIDRAELPMPVLPEWAHVHYGEDLIDGLRREPDASWDTVICLEVLEHLLPQLHLATLAELWRVTRKRLVLSGPSPQAQREYPHTEHFFGASNPDHLYEASEFRILALVHAMGGMKQNLVFRGWLERNEEVVWDFGSGPTAYWLMALEKEGWC